MFKNMTMAACLLALVTASARAESNFSSTTIDLGIVVADVEKSVKFYTEALGFKETKGFEVSGEYGKQVGLTPGKALKIRVLVLGEGDSATKLKLMEFPGEKPKKNDNEFVSSELGYRYLTIFVKDTTASLELLEKAKVKPISNGPHPLPKGFPEGVFLTIIRDPDGNLVELVGPKK